MTAQMAAHQAIESHRAMMPVAAQQEPTARRPTMEAIMSVVRLFELLSPLVGGFDAWS